MMRLTAVLMTFISLMFCSLSWLHGDAVPEEKQRLLEDIKFLASDDLEGRGVGTNGLNVAAEFVKNEFAKAGLAVDRVDGTAFQTFEVVTGSKLLEPYNLSFTGPEGATIDLKIGSEAEVGSFGGSGSFDSGIVFCGYGIDTTSDPLSDPHAPDPHATNKEDPKKETFKYNDFEGVNVEGKVVIFIRRNPRQSDPKSPLGAEHGISRYAELRTKMSQAAAYKAAAVLIVNDPYSLKKSVDKINENVRKANEKVVAAAEAFLAADPDDNTKTVAAKNALTESVNQVKSVRQAAENMPNDALMKFGYAGSGDSMLPPAFHISVKTCNQILASSKTDVATLESEIDSDLKPRSFVINGWKAKGAATVEKSRANISNVIGVIDGEGPLADETVIIGAHYDHVGRGGANSLAPGSTEIHNGADDNASGTVTLLELARHFGRLTKEKPLPRRLVFIAFTGEEMGLLGSARYCKQPVFPLDKTIAMLNMDMVGRLKDDKLIVYGTGTSPRWESELNKSNHDLGLKLLFKPEGFGPSDHSSFYAKKIPVLHFFTGEHSDYHRPSDDWEKINIDGVERVGELMERVVIDTLNDRERPEYVEVKGAGGPGRGGSRPYVGTIPDFGNEEPGYAISGVVSGGPGDKAGLKGGDRIVKVGPNKVTNLDDFDAALRKFAPGDKVDFVVIRANAEITVNLTLDPPR